jgi:hypothetical protein
MQFPSSKPKRIRCWKTANQNPPLKWNTSHFMPCHLTTPPSRGRALMALCRMLLIALHLTMVATAYAAQQTLSLVMPISRPYLATFGAPALRFQEVPPPPPPLAKPIASGPPVAAGAPVIAEVTLANDQAAASIPSLPPGKPQPEAKTPTLPAESPEATPPAEKPHPTVQPLPIIPDDTRAKVQSQDFLPLFRFPGKSGAGEDVTVVAPGIPTPPSPNSLPPSSATYRQY